jgi:hypothetical protein
MGHPVAIFERYSASLSATENIQAREVEVLEQKFQLVGAEPVGAAPVDSGSADSEPVDAEFIDVDPRALFSSACRISIVGEQEVGKSTQLHGLGKHLCQPSASLSSSFIYRMDRFRWSFVPLTIPSCWYFRLAH